MTKHVTEVKKLSRMEIARPLASSALEEKLQQIDKKQIMVASLLCLAFSLHHMIQSAINLRVCVNKSSIPFLLSQVCVSANYG